MRVDRTDHSADSGVETVEDDADQRPPRLPPDTPGAPGVPSRLDNNQVAAGINEEQAETSGERDPGTSKQAEDVTAEQRVERAENKPETEAGEQKEAGECRAADDVASGETRQASIGAAEAETTTEQHRPVIPLDAEEIGGAAVDEEACATAEAVEKEALAEYEDGVVRDGRAAPTDEPEDPADATPTPPTKPDEDNDGQHDVLGKALSDDQRSPAPLDKPRTEPTEQPESTEVSATNAVDTATGDAATNGDPEDSAGNDAESEATEPLGLAGDLDMGPPDEPGSWRGNGGQYLNMEENLVTDHAFDRIGDVEAHVTGDLSAIEGEIPDGQLVGLEYRLKGEDRFKEKISYETRRKPDRSISEIAERVPDAVRYTYEFDKEHYVQGYRDVRDRLEDRGYELIYARNSWADSQYKGINTRWRTPEGQLFEVQLHTPDSFRAKQLTHSAYERLRNPATSDEEREQLHAFQRQVSESIPVPDEVATISDYRKRGH